MTTLVMITVPCAIVVVLVVLARFSQRLGAVTRRPPQYQWLYFSGGLVLGGAALRLWGALTASEAGVELSAEIALLYDVPTVIGLLIAVVVTWRYWSWLIYEQDTTQLEDRSEL